MRISRSHYLPLTIGAVGLLCAVGLLWAQEQANRPPAPPPPNASTDPLLRGFEFRSIGPATMMGRVDDIQGADKDPMIDLRRLRHGRPLEIDRRRQSLAFAVRHHAGCIDRRDRYRSFRSERRVCRHGRGQQPAKLVDRRRHVGHHRRRQDLDPPGPGRHAIDRPHRGRSDESECRLRGRRRPSVRAQSGARSV